MVKRPAARVAINEMWLKLRRFIESSNFRWVAVDLTSRRQRLAARTQEK